MDKQKELLKDEKEREAQQRLLARNTLESGHKNFLSDEKLFSRLKARQSNC